MRNLKNIILLLATSLVWSCQMFEEGHIEPTTDDWGDKIEVLDNGQFRYTTTLKSVSMTSVETRATSYEEDVIRSGWCMVFGEDETEHAKPGDQYTDESPLIQIMPIVAHENGTFSIIFDEYPNVAFIRIVVNLTAREEERFNSAKTWSQIVKEYKDDAGFSGSLAAPPTIDQVKTYGITTFGEFRYQSVGLDGIYNMSGVGGYNTNAPLRKFDEPYTNLNGEPSHYGIVYETDGSSNTGSSNIAVDTPIAETYNENQPNASFNKVVSNGFPMASYGFGLPNITPESIEALDEEHSQIQMIRACSKVRVAVVDDDNADGIDFTVSEIYLVGAAQEARIRSTTFSAVDTPITLSADAPTNGTPDVVEEFVVPKDLGGTIDYRPLKETVTTGGVSNPIYFYPNKGGSYKYVSNVVNQDVNPQYIIIKGKSSAYDVPGYYKVALKAQYPLTGDADESNMNDRKMWSALTYDILRNTSFTVNILNVNKPGYATYEVAADPNAPASNISYSLTIESSNNRYEILVSNGTYYTELETSRVYVKGYMGAWLENCYLDFTMHPSQDGNYTPGVYVQSSDHDGLANDDDVAITHCMVMYEGDDGYDSDDWSKATTRFDVEGNVSDGSPIVDGLLPEDFVHVPKSNKSTKVRVYYNVKDSGRIRLRMGDILKFIPVVYDPKPISIYGTKGQGKTDTDPDPGIVVTDAYGNSWDDFSYAKSSDITYTYEHVDFEHGGVIDTDFVIEPNGTVIDTNIGVYNDKPELRARISPAEAGDGNAVIYLRQASDFTLADKDGNDFDEDADYEVVFTAQGSVHANNTHGLFKTVEGNDTEADKIVFDATSTDITSESVDDVTISIATEVKQADKDSNGNYLEFFDDVLENNNQKLSLTVQKMNYQNQAYTSKPANMITQENIAKSTVTVQNSAGDHKKYTVKQTQYPPVYLVTPEGGVKDFMIDGTPSNEERDEVAVYVINLYNYDAADSGYSVTTEWKKTSGENSNFNIFKSVMYECTLSRDYLEWYDNNNKEDHCGGFFGLGAYYYEYASDKTYTGKKVSGGTKNFTQMAELEMRKTDLFVNDSFNFDDTDDVGVGADAAFVLMRNTDDMDNAKNVTDNVGVTILITVKDKYGQEYTASKSVTGLN